MARGVLLELEHHLLEHLEGLFFVCDQGVLLGVAAQADALLEVVHGEEVVLPEAVEDGEHDDAFVVAHGGSAEDLLLEVVTLADPLEDGFAEFVAAEQGGVDGVGAAVELDAEDVEELSEDHVEVPLAGM